MGVDWVSSGTFHTSKVEGERTEAQNKPQPALLDHVVGRHFGRLQVAVRIDSLQETVANLVETK